MFTSPLLAIAIFVLATSARSSEPYEISWSESTFGPDGPWHVVKTTIGSTGETLNLFPGTTWQSWVITSDSCDRGSTCYASNAGTYNIDDNHGSSGGISATASLSGFMHGVNLEGDSATRWMDEMDIGGGIVENVSLALLNSSETSVKYPGGQTEPLFAGCLSVGANGVTNQSFSRDTQNLPPINASIPPGYMWEHGMTPSNSFGMHIGSVQPSLGGSLWFGGYDQNRVVGEVLTSNGDFTEEGITLRDISIDVIGEDSPFTFDGDTKAGLLAKGNSSIGTSLKVIIDGCSPYLTLPKSTCDNIATYLPVYYNENLGLYLWDTTSDKYEEIVSSASALAFSFIANSNTDPIKIRVPLMHLNLTLTSPLAETPKPYFPCHVNGGESYVLGRAFLQDAFLGANWKVGKWWLAQAPGRNIQAVSNTITIEEDDDTISKGGNDWEASWSGVWVDKGAKVSSTPVAKKETYQEEEDGMSVGAKAGVGIGITVGVLAIVLGFLFWRRRHGNTSRSVSEQTQQTPSSAWTMANEPAAEYAYVPPTRMEKQPPAEVDGRSTTKTQYQIFELPG